MNKTEFIDYIAKKRKNEHELSQVAQLVKMFEDRCADLEASLKRATGWSNKEVLRKSLKVNQDLLNQAKSKFWEENL